MNTLKIFNSNEFGKMRTYRDPRTGEVWFNLNDACKCLDIVNPWNASARLNENEKMSKNIRLESSLHSMEETPTKDLGGNPNMTFVSESGLYKIIFQSRKPNAAKFQDWVCSEVLPSIHKYGVYITKEVANDDKRLNEAIQAIKEEYKEKIEFADAFLGSEDSAYIGVFADYLTKNGIKIGRNQLFKWFKEKKVLVMYGDEYYPSAKYMKMGLFDLDASIISKTNGRKKISHTVKITPKGMNYFLKKIQPTKAKKAQKQLDFVQMALFDFI